MNQTIFSHPNPIHIGRLYDKFPFATVGNYTYGHYNRHVSQQEFINDLINNNVISGSVDTKKSKKNKEQYDFKIDNPKIKEIFKNMKLTKNEYNLAKKYFEKINKKKLTKRNILLFEEDKQDNIMLNDFLKPLDTDNITEYWKDYNRFPFSLKNGTWNKSKDDLIKAKMNYLYVLKMIFSPGNDHLDNPKDFDDYSQGDHFAICYMLLIDNDPVSVYLILYHLYLNNKNSIKLKFYSKISQVNNSNDSATKMACIYYHILKICYPNFFKKNNFYEFFGTINPKVFSPFFGLWQIANDNSVNKNIKDSYNIINLYLKNGISDIFLIFTAFLKKYLKNKEDNVTGMEGYIIDLEVIHNGNLNEIFYNKTPYKEIESMRKKINKRYGSMSKLLDKILNHKKMDEILKEVSDENFFVDINDDIFKKIKIRSTWTGGKRKTKKRRKSSIKQYTNNGWVVVNKKRKTRRRRKR